MLRAAYFGQELLSTFGTTIGEIALIPATGGVFTVNLTYKPQEPAAKFSDEIQATTVLLWDRKAEGGFPGTRCDSSLHIHEVVLMHHRD
jgi:predicted Rdx family selenoprotein